MLTVVVLLCITAYGAVAGPIVPRVNTGGYRLSGEIVPSDYDIYIDVSETLTKKEPWEFQGKVIINAKSTSDKEIKQIVLHASKMNILDIKVNNENAIHTFEETREFLYITLEGKHIAPQGDVTINIQYKGYLRDDMYGFYISSYKKQDDKEKDEYVATTQFQPTHARSAFPCFDEPQYKAQFKIKIAIPDGYTAISNMPVKNPARANPKVIEFEQTPIMSTYLVAFIVSKFQYKVGSDDNFRVWARPTAINQTEYAASIVQNLTEQMRNFTNVNYFGDEEPTMKMKKMDMVALPDFAAGAMENWGLLTYRETALLVDDNVSTKRNVQRVASVIAHELAHQWFGDYVTTKWWDNTWLNEGFARYFEYYATGAVYPNWEMAEQFVVEQQQAVFVVDSLNNTTPLNNHVETPTQISSHFGSISYNKGGSIIRMMEHFLGTEKFKTGLHEYLKKNAFTSTTPDQLWEPFTENIVDKIKLSEIMKNWINNPGYPVIYVSRDNMTVTIKQERFHLQSQNTTGEKWYVPISYTTSNESSFESTKPKLWLKDSESEKKFNITVNDDWIIVNIQGSGYYRVNYDDNLWSELQKVLKSDDADKKIHRLNRAQLIDDAMNLARGGQLDYTVALEIVDYLSKEKDYYPWYSAFEAFRYLLQRYADNDDTGSDIRAYILTLMHALIEDIKFDIEVSAMKPTDVYKYVNTLQWACDLGEEKCVSASKKLFEKLKDNSATIDKNIKSVVYCTAIRHGSKEDWNHLWNMYKTSNVNAEQVTILNALGCSKDKDQLKWYLEESVKSIRKQDAASVFSAVYAGNSQGVLIAFEFLKNNFTEIAQHYGGMNALGNAIRGLADRLNTNDQITDFEKFLEKEEDKLNDVKEIAAAAIEKAKANVNWANKYKTDIVNFLQKKKKNGSSAVTSSVVLCVALATLVSYFTQ